MNFLPCEWLRHSKKMDQTRPASKPLYWKPMGIRRVGRPRQRWQDNVLEDIKKVKLKNWKEIAKNRITWRDLVGKANTHKGL